MNALILKVPPSIQFTDEQFYEFCRANRDLRIERTASGELIVMPPAGGLTGKYNSSLTAQVWLWNEQTQLGLWNEQTQLGVVFDSSSGFKLPNGGDRSPDVAWIPLQTWDQLTPEQQERFLPLSPDFVIELRSPSDALAPLQEKMQEYLVNGTRLGLLLNRQDRQVEVYRSQQVKTVLEAPIELSSVLPGFTLKLASFWSV